MKDPHLALYSTHFEELSFLQEHWRDGLNSPEVDLDDLRLIEARMIAHVDALVIGSAEAPLYFEDAIETEAPGIYYALARVFARSGQAGLMEVLLSEADDGEEDIQLALRDALRLDLPIQWESRISKLLTEQTYTGAIAQAAGRKGFKVGPKIVNALERSPPEYISWHIAALGWLKERQATMQIFRYLQQDDPTIGRAAAWAGLRIAPTEINDPLRRSLADHAWATIPWVVSGAKDARKDLIPHLNRGAPDAAIALGLLGDVWGVEVLLSALDRDPPMAEAAAIGLFLITGAELETVPPESDEQDLDEAPRFCGSQILWKAWWQENQHNFRRGPGPYRLGRPLGIESRILCLKEPRIPFDIRWAVAEEVLIHHGVDVLPDMPASTQQSRLMQLESSD